MSFEEKNEAPQIRLTKDSFLLKREGLAVSKSRTARIYKKL